MNTLQKNTTDFKIKGNWAEQSKLLKEKFPKLTDADLKYVADKESELLTRIGKRLNKNQVDVINIINKIQPVKQ